MTDRVTDEWADLAKQLAVGPLPLAKAEIPVLRTLTLDLLADRAEAKARIAELERQLDYAQKDADAATGRANRFEDAFRNQYRIFDETRAELQAQLDRANRIIGWMMPYIGKMCVPPNGLYDLNLHCLENHVPLPGAETKGAPTGAKK